ncbi:hypothetical protein RCCS2_04494 [Roseobacter sp. CCS2]|nr:hypothetical protein RCCS2_04494 [Roseobacter sp. CCS2]
MSPPNFAGGMLVKVTKRRGVTSKPSLFCFGAVARTYAAV